MTTSSDTEFLLETLQLAADALDAMKDRTDLSIRYKSDDSLVTAADLASEKVILDRIRAYHPKDLIYSEESGLSSKERSPGRSIWIVDPLDGTTNYANGYPFYCVSIGRGTFDDTGKIVINLGGIYDCSQNVSYHAVKGEGAYAEGRRLSLGKARPLSKCFLSTGFYYLHGDDLEAQIRRFARVAQHCQSIRRDGAAALDLALVAAGVFDGFWELGLQPWDLAAGILLVEEAGGRVANYDLAATFDLEGQGVIAGHDEVVQGISVLL